MATFRPLLKKKKASIRSGAGADDVFQPIWFEYDAMESFLGAIYDVENTINTEGEPEQTKDQTDEPEQTVEVGSLTQDTGENKENEEEEKGEENIKNRKMADDMKTQAHASKRRRIGQAFDAEVAQKQLNDNFKTLNQVLQSKQHNLEDDCDLYSKLLATKLKRYSVHQRQRVMYKIDGLLIDNPPETCSSTPIPSSSASRPLFVHTPQASLAYSHDSQASVDLQCYQPSPTYSHDSQASGYSQHSQPPPVDTKELQPMHTVPNHLLSKSKYYKPHYKKAPSSTPYSSKFIFAQSSQPSPLHIHLLKAPLQDNHRTTPYSPHPSPAQISHPSPLHLEPTPLEEGVPLSTTSNIIQSAFLTPLQK